jgi:hypothetical protein
MLPLPSATPAPGEAAAVETAPAAAPPTEPPRQATLPGFERG